MSRHKEERDVAIKSVESIRHILTDAADKIEDALNSGDLASLYDLAKNLRHAVKNHGYVKPLDD